MDISQLSRRFHVNAERGSAKNFPVFLHSVRGKRVAVIADPNTVRYAEPVLGAMKGEGCDVSLFVFPDPEPVADRAAIETARSFAGGKEYLLAVGSGTMNDVAKYAGHLSGIPCGVFATAPSMDGFTSGVAALIEDGFKITRPAQTVRDVLIDTEVLASAPRIMLGAGVGDIFAKYCCLADWRLSARLTGEEYNEEAADMMGSALRACADSVPDLIAGGKRGAEKLMDALLVSGYAMVVAGSSRPASGAEHHMSHFLEMDFLRRGERIPLHGVKVGLGTAVSLYLYHTLKTRPAFEGCEIAYEEAEKLPSPEYVLNVLGSFGCPTRFSELGIGEETFRDMLENAYKIRDRFTVLNLYCTRGLMTEEVIEELSGRFFR